MQQTYERENWNIQQILYDYIAGMTDQYAIKVVRDYYIPDPIESFKIDKQKKFLV